MKTFKLGAVSAAVAVALTIAPAAIGSASQRVGQYDFSYLLSGQGRAVPVQVFDNGQTTYFQFRAGESVPAIFSHLDGKVDLAVPKFEGPYITVTGLAPRYTLQLGNAQANVVYGGTGRAGTPTISSVAPSGLKQEYRSGYPTAPGTRLVASLNPAAAVAAALDLESNSYATPVKGDRVAWKQHETRIDEHRIWFKPGQYKLASSDRSQLAALGKKLGQATSITVTGRDDDTFKEGIELARAKEIQKILVSAGVPESKITVKTGIQSPSQKGMWASDITVETLLPTAVSKPEVVSDSEAKARYVKANVENLLRQGVITREQAQVMLNKVSGAPPTQPAQEKPVQATVVVAAPEMPPGGFDFQATDGTVSVSLRRWGVATNYRVVWDAPKTTDAPITGAGSVSAKSMVEAVEIVVAGLRSRGYPVQADIYNNRVIHFTGVSAK